MTNFMPHSTSRSHLRLSRRRAVALAAGAVMATTATAPRSAAQEHPDPTTISAADADTPPSTLPLPSTLAADASAEFRTVADALVAAMQQHHVPGAALGILAGDREEYATFGVASSSSLAPVGPDTLFQIGSCTKTFTATATWHLIDAGVLALDAPVRNYLPEFRVADEAASTEATIANLLNHTGGWLGDRMPGDPGGNDAIARYVSDVMPSLPQLFPLGEFFSYNNSGFIVLGRLIELATGATYDAAMRELLFAPLGLEATVLDHVEVLRRPYADGHSFGPVNGQDVLTVSTPLWLPRVLNPTGGIWTTARDMMRYARFHLEPGTVAGSSRVVQPESLQRMQAPAKGVPGLPISMGMNWLIQEVDGVRAIQHGGNTLGQSADLVVIPEKRFAIATLTNCNSGGQATRAALNAALASYPGLTSLAGKVGVSQALAVDPSIPTVSLPAEKLAEYVGRYATERQELVFTAADDGLAVTDVPILLPDQWHPDIPPPFDADGLSPQPVSFAAEDQALGLGMRLPFIRDTSGRVGWVGVWLRLLPRPGED